MERPTKLAMLMSLIGIALSAGAMAGVKRGWAYTVVASSAHPWAPPMKVQLSLGWWRSTSRVVASWIPDQTLEVESKAAKGVGATTVGLLGVASLFALLVVAQGLAEELRAALPFQHNLDNKQLATAFRIVGMVACGASVSLYATLAFGVHSKLADESSGQINVFPRPDWAAACGFLAGGLWCTAAQQFEAAAGSPLLSGYLPV